MMRIIVQQLLTFKFHSHTQTVSMVSFHMNHPVAILISCSICSASAHPLGQTKAFHILINTIPARDLWTVTMSNYVLSPSPSPSPMQICKSNENHAFLSHLPSQADKMICKYLGWNDIVGDVPYTCAIDSTWNSDVQFSVVSHCDALHFSRRGTNNFVKLLIASVPPDHIAADTDHNCSNVTHAQHDN